MPERTFAGQRLVARAVYQDVVVTAYRVYLGDCSSLNKRDGPTPLTPVALESVWMLTEAWLELTSGPH